MYITLEADYAVRIVSVLCLDKEKKIDAKTISERASVTLRFSLKILRKLVGAGIVKSFKGTQGGYKVNMEPHDITLRMVIEAIEGKYVFSRCISEEIDCNRDMSGRCVFQKAFADVSNTVRKKLESYNFEDMIKDSAERSTQQKVPVAVNKEQ